MSVVYREAFKINNVLYGIEDYEDGESPSSHFMADRPHKRFQLWRGGCGIGQVDTIEEARQSLFTYVQSQTNAEYHGFQQRMINARKILDQLGDDKFNLGVFRVKT